MKSTVRYLGDWLLSKVPLSGYHNFVKRDVIGIFYHMVSDRIVPHTEHLYPHRDINTFEQDLVYVKKNYQVLNFDDLLTGRNLNQRKHTPGIYISFDDGFSECFSLVRPLLLKYGLPCIFFITTNFIDNKQMYYRNKVSLCIDKYNSLSNEVKIKTLSTLSDQYQAGVEKNEPFINWIKKITDDSQINNICKLLDIDIEQYLNLHKPYLTTEEIQSMAAEGFTIGAHSKNHQKLARLNKDETEDEIIGSVNLIREISGQELVPFSFPNTATGIKRELLDRIMDSNPSIGLLFDAKGLEIDRDYMYNRIWVESPKLNAGGNEPIQQVIENAYKDFVLQGLNQ